ncbi:MAG: hypothetical protein HQL34_12950 [Alphaproteobacteria bacterium]|nr:hypothetical protein [Alphaproteobacteria bacterium]
MKLTQHGNLARTVVATMLDAFRWPGYGPTDPPMFYAVVNEPDFLPLYFLRLTMEEAGLLEPHKGHHSATCRPTRPAPANSACCRSA